MDPLRRLSNRKKRFLSKVAKFKSTPKEFEEKWEVGDTFKDPPEGWDVVTDDEEAFLVKDDPNNEELGFEMIAHVEFTYEGPGNYFYTVLEVYRQYLKPKLGESFDLKELGEDWEVLESSPEGFYKERKTPSIWLGLKLLPGETSRKSYLELQPDPERWGGYVVVNGIFDISYSVSLNSEEEELAEEAPSEEEIAAEKAENLAEFYKNKFQQEAPKKSPIDETLEDKLNQAIKQENYEEANKIKQQIEELEKQFKQSALMKLRRLGRSHKKRVLGTVLEEETDSSYWVLPSGEVRGPYEFHSLTPDEEIPEELFQEFLKLQEDTGIIQDLPSFLVSKGWIQVNMSPAYDDVIVVYNKAMGPDLASLRNFLIENQPQDKKLSIDDSYNPLLNKDMTNYIKEMPLSQFIQEASLSSKRIKTERYNLI